MGKSYVRKITILINSLLVSRKWNGEIKLLHSFAGDPLGLLERPGRKLKFVWDVGYRSCIQLHFMLFILFPVALIYSRSYVYRIGDITSNNAKCYLHTETKLMFIQTWLMDPHIHLEQHVLFGWHTWNSNCLGTKLICTLVHEHSGIFLICYLANLSSHSGSVMAWRQLGMIYSLACVHREQMTFNWVSNNSCALAKSCHISTCAGVTPTVAPLRHCFLLSSPKTKSIEPNSY